MDQDNIKTNNQFLRMILDGVSSKETHVYSKDIDRYSRILHGCSVVLEFISEDHVVEIYDMWVGIKYPQAILYSDNNSKSPLFHLNRFLPWHQMEIDVQEQVRFFIDIYRL